MNLTCRGLYASYGKKDVLHDVSLELQSGEFSCLCGSNGSGKSTLLALLAGLPPPSLKFTFQEFQPNTTSLPRKKSARLVAYVQQNETCAWDFSVLEYVVQARFSYTVNGAYSREDYAAASRALEILSIQNLESRGVLSLSGGEFQKVRLARAFAQEPSFILLDEPASSLDFVYEPHLMSLLRELSRKNNVGILASVHNVNLAAEFTDKMNMLYSGGIISGTPEQIMKSEILEKIYGVPFECRKISSFQSSL